MITMVSLDRIVGKFSSHHVQQSNHGSDISIRPRGNQTFFMLDSTEHEILTVHIN